MSIPLVQKALSERTIDGWLLYDFRGNNPLCRSFLQVSQEEHLTRRFFYWIPASGEPIALVHAIEPSALDHLPGEKRRYLRWDSLRAHLAEILKNAHRVAMEYSPSAGIPSLSHVDAGTIDLVRAQNVEVVSSGPLLGLFSSTWDDKKLQSHLEAAQFLDRVVEEAWQLISNSLEKGMEISECAVQDWLVEQFDVHGFVSDSPPMCATGVHTADPHYSPNRSAKTLIQRGDIILLDLWCKKKEKGAVYADITRVGVVAKSPSSRQQEIFDIVKRARDVVTAFVQLNYEAGREIKGCEVDEVCRKVIEEAGYGDYFLHRTGHNIDMQVHGPGTHIDNFETRDDRPLVPHTCFSIEPGIYLPNEFGVRLEYDLYLASGSVLISGGIQNRLRTLVEALD